MSIKTIEERVQEYIDDPNVITSRDVHPTERKEFRVGDSRVVVMPHNYIPPKKELLGDRVEKYLKKINVTEENYKAAKEALGALPDCNCSDRKKILNRIEEYAEEHGWIKAALNSLKIREEYYREKANEQSVEVIREDSK